VSGRAAQKADQVLRLALKAAIREGVMTVSVMDRVDKPAHVKKEAESFDVKTAMHIIATAIEHQGQMWAARWATGFLTGARESEILGLEWDRVHFDRGLMDISWQLQRQPKVHGCGPQDDGKWPCGFVRPGYCPEAVWRFPRGDYRECTGTLCWTRPKTAAGRRIIPIVPALAEILESIREPNPHGLVFHHPDGRPIDQEQDQKAWKALLIAANIPHLPQHSIRHSTATLLLEAGVDVHVVQSVIGHSDIAMTRGYQHVDVELAKRAWATLPQLLPPRP
jgi:integrase